MKGRIRTESVCPVCHVKFAPVRHPLTGDVIDLMCTAHLTRPTKGVYIDGRPFKNRKGGVGYVSKDDRGHKFDSPMAALRYLETIRHDWDKDSVAFDASKYSNAGRWKHSLKDVWWSWHREMERTRSRIYGIHIETFGRLHVLPLLGGRDVREMTREDVSRLDAAIEAKGLSPQSRKTALDLLYSALRYAKDNKLLSLDDFPPRPRIKSAKKNRRLLRPCEQAIIRELMPEYTRTLMDVLYATGARPGEICALKMMDVLPDRRILIQRGLNYWGVEGPPKNGQSRYTDPLPVELYDRLVALPCLPAAYLFRNWFGRPLLTPVLSKYFRVAADRIGLGDVTLYTARHTMATITAREVREAGIEAAAKRIGNTKRVAEKHYVMEGE